MKHSIACILVAMLVSTSPAMSADDWTLSLDLHGASKHFGTDRDFNTVNKGVGITATYGLNSAIFGRYENSIYRNTIYFGYSRSLIYRGMFEISWSIAAATGYMVMDGTCNITTVDGSPGTKECKPLAIIPIPSLTLSARPKENIGVIIRYIPKTVPGTLPVIGISMTIPIF